MRFFPFSLLMIASLLAADLCSEYKPVFAGVPQQASPTPAPCPVSRIHDNDLLLHGVRGIPWIRAQPTRSHLFGVLFFTHREPDGTYVPLHTGGTMPDGAATKILWLIDRPGAGRKLVIRVQNLMRAGTFRQTFPGSNEVPSILKVPNPGCWRVQLTSGTIAGTVTLQAVG